MVESAASLEQFCSTILNTVKNCRADDSFGSAVCSQLTRILENAAHEMSSELERESQIIADTIAQLQRLQQTRLPDPNRLRTQLIDELQRTQRFTAGIVHGLSFLGRNPALPTIAPTPPPTLQAIETSQSRIETSLYPVSDTIPATTPTAPDPFESPALQLCKEAEQHRRRHDYERAETRYGEAIALDPQCGEAYAGRGVLYLLAGCHEDAVADFSDALKLQANDAELLARRGDAYARAGHLIEAIADYRSTLDKQPGLYKVRFNLGVALRRREERAQALVEFALVLAAKPDYAAAYYQRGCIHLERGSYADAVAQFKIALQYKPDYDEANEQLELATQQERERIKALTKSRLEATRTQNENPTTVIPPKPTPPAVSTSTDHQLPFRCPACQHTGTIPWNLLNKILSCPQCQHKIAVKADGKPVEVTRQENGNWIELELQRTRRSRSRKRRLIALALSICLLPLTSFVVWKSVHPTKQVAANELPKDLKARGELFGRAWLRNDVPLMRRLTAPSHDRVLYSWYNNHRPPIAPATGIRETLPETVKLDVRVPVVPGETNNVAIVMEGIGALGSPTPTTELSLQWQQSGDTWFVVPPKR